MSPQDPLIQYRQALASARAEQTHLQGRNRAYIAAKIALFVLLAVLVLVLHASHGLALLLLIPVALLVVVFGLHERVLRALARSKRRIHFYEQGVARLEDRWRGKGVSGVGFVRAEHLYARDLDVFGPGSLFELLCQCRTRAGMAELARWLCEPASAEQVVARQEAVAELTPRLDLRERIALASEAVEQAGVAPEKFVEWAEAGSKRSRIFSRLIAPLLALLWLAALLNVLLAHLYHGAADSVLWLVLISVVNYSVSRWGERAAHEAADAAELAIRERELVLLAALFAEIESESFAAGHLVALHRAISAEGVATHRKASRALGQLRRRLVWLESRHNIFLRIFAPFLFLTTFFVAPLERWRERSGASVSGWLAAAGEHEALLSLASFAAEHPQARFPRFTSEEQTFYATGLTHPLLPADKAVANDVRLDAQQQMILLSGANMAGKSTLLRAIGLNAVLAQAGAPVCAAGLTLSPLVVAASICVLDSLQGGVSRFYAEIARLKGIEVAAEQTHRVLFLLDELLSGTNSEDRRAGTEAFVRILLGHGAIGVVTTHDLALTAIVDDLGGRAANYHFDDDFEDGELRFSYQMRPGIVRTSNALRLMRSVGLGV